MLDSVEIGLLPLREQWDDITEPIDSLLLNIILPWAWTQTDLQQAVREAYRLKAGTPVDSVRESFFEVIRRWLSGSTFLELAIGGDISIDDVLGLHSRVITFVFQTIIEQAVALLEKLLQSQGQTIAPVVAELPEHIRFGVPTPAGLALAYNGVRHRRAYVALGATNDLLGFSLNNKRGLFHATQVLLKQEPEEWKARLGQLVFERTIRDLSNDGDIGT